MQRFANFMAQFQTQDQHGLRGISLSLLILGSVSIGSEASRAQSIPGNLLPTSEQQVQSDVNRSPSASPKSETQSPTSSAQPSVTETVRLGDDRYAQADYEGAVEAYSQALQAYKLNAYALYNRANAYRQLEKYEIAIADYSAALKIAPDNLFAYLYRGMALAENKQLEAALADFSTVIEQNPKHALAFQKRGESHLAMDNPTAALEDLQQAATLYEEDEKFRKYSQVQEQIKQAKSARSNRSK